MKDKLSGLNNARFGSFGEFVFESCYSSKKLFRKHNERIDFILDGKPIDIKSRRLLTMYYKKPANYYGKRITGIEYILIQFYENIVIISNDNNILKKISYARIEKLYNEWSLNRKNITKLVHKIDDTILNRLKIKIKNHFKSINLSVRIIYRTNQKDFGVESPDNLLKKSPNNIDVTVFLNFKDKVINENNLEEIIAFRNSDSKNFSYISNPKLHKPKVDLAKINKKYKYKNINSLINNWS